MDQQVAVASWWPPPTTNFPLRSFHCHPIDFRMLWFHFLLFQDTFYCSFIFSLIHWLFQSVLFHFHWFTKFSAYFLLWMHNISYIPLWFEKQRHHFADKGPYSQSDGFSSSHVWMWEWCFWIVVMEKTLESPLDCKDIQPVHPKGNQYWIFIGRTDAEAKAPILWPADAKSWLIGKDPDAGKYQRRQWHPTPVLLPGKSHGRRSLVGYSPWGREEKDMTERHHFHFSLSCTGEGNGNTVKYSCLENPMDGEAWWATVHGVAKNQTQLSD